jgi:hypothetical protein
MTTRSHRALFGLAAALLSLTLVSSASAQGMNLGQQLQRQLTYGVANMIPGSQPAYQSPYYGAGQPYYSPYQAQPMGYGWPTYQPQTGVTANRRGLPFRRGGGTYYQQPGSSYYQPGATTTAQPRYDQQLQQTSYTAPAVQRYQIPAQYAGTPAGYVITYGGRNYLSGSDGTMTPYNGPVAQ